MPSTIRTSTARHSTSCRSSRKNSGLMSIQGLSLPCLILTATRNWRGEAYSIIILCQDVRTVTTADDVATSLGQGKTPAALLQASLEDIDNATQLLRQVVLASALCLMKKEGPSSTQDDNEEGGKLWEKHKDKLITLQSVARIEGKRDDIFNSVVFPVCESVPQERFVAKLKLSEMTLPEKVSAPAYPDPLLPAFKSSVNWTRLFGFQLVAEAEPPEDPLELNPRIPGMVLLEGK